MADNTRAPHRYLTTPTEQLCLAVMLEDCIWEVLGSNVDRAPVVLTEVFRGFRQSLQTYRDSTSIRPRPLPFQFIKPNCIMFSVICF
jgi:hypothetical protein